MTYPIIPIRRLTEYHLPYLRAAEGGRLHYDRSLWPIHGVPNNALACYWGGLLADGDGGMQLTDEGHARLNAWKNSPEGRVWLARRSAEAEQDEPVSEVPSSEEPAVVSTRPIHDDGQLSLFA